MTKEDRFQEIQKLIEKRDLLITERDLLNIKINQYNDHISGNVKNVEKLNHADIVVSDHAMLRYIERVMGVDISKIKDEIVTDTVRLGLAFAKSGRFINGNGSMVVVVDNVVKTTWAA